MAPQGRAAALTHLIAAAQSAATSNANELRTRRKCCWRQYAACVTAQIGDQPTDAELDAAVRILKLLADPTRLRIVWALLHGEHSVNDLADHVGARPPAVSQHLAKLRAADLVRVRRDGNRLFYAARNEDIERLAAEALLHADHLVAVGRHHDTEAKTA